MLEHHDLGGGRQQQQIFNLLYGVGYMNLFSPLCPFRSRCSGPCIFVVVFRPYIIQRVAAFMI
ncbi:hypothetical protein KFK09_011987 [Dendrobium nobile]|uniref:Uncharacterized protein n=1 Tax=Dendrobium nobile TaxID=94219 RepID=A0A8T3BGK9_DENNO|nr:hypothetical protein KFK09_011987 [Dendrobium nobile]